MLIPNKQKTKTFIPKMWRNYFSHFQRRSPNNIEWKFYFLLSGKNWQNDLIGLMPWQISRQVLLFELILQSLTVSNEAKLFLIIKMGQLFWIKKVILYFSFFTVWFLKSNWLGKVQVYPASKCIWSILSKCCTLNKVV